MSGFSLDDVQVHYNSTLPAQLKARAFASGSDIHIGTDQEDCLPHEAWHIVQQLQGRVRPTRLMDHFQINDDPVLENQADLMGKKALTAVKPIAHLKYVALPHTKTAQFCKLSPEILNDRVATSITAILKENGLSISPTTREKIKQLIMLNITEEDFSDDNYPNLCKSIKITASTCLAYKDLAHMTYNPLEHKIRKYKNEFCFARREVPTTQSHPVKITDFIVENQSLFANAHINQIHDCILAELQNDKYYLNDGKKAIGRAVFKEAQYTASHPINKETGHPDMHKLTFDSIQDKEYCVFRSMPKSSAQNILPFFKKVKSLIKSNDIQIKTNDAQFVLSQHAYDLIQKGIKLDSDPNSTLIKASHVLSNHGADIAQALRYKGCLVKFIVDSQYKSIPIQWNTASDDIPGGGEGSIKSKSIPGPNNKIFEVNLGAKRDGNSFSFFFGRTGGTGIPALLFLATLKNIKVYDLGEDGRVE